MRHEFILFFYKKYVLHAIFLLKQDSHSFGHIPVKFHCDGSIFWYTQTPTYVKVTTICYDHRSSVCMLDSDDSFTE